MRVIKVFKDLHLLVSSLLMLLLHMSEVDLLEDVCQLILQRLHSVHDAVRPPAQFGHDLEITHFISYCLPIDLGKLVVSRVERRVFRGGQVTQQ